jgi:hypothetical protein
VNCGEVDVVADLAFASYLVGNREWLEATGRQAWVYNEIGDIGFRTDAFRSYRESVGRYVVEKLRPVFKPEYLKWFVEKYGDDKARRAWSAVVTLSAFHKLELLKAAGARPGEFLPEEYAKFEYVVPLLDDLVEEMKKARVPIAVRRVFERLGEDRALTLAPFLWWLNMVMESEALEDVLKFHYTGKPARPIEAVEGCLMFVKLWRRSVGRPEEWHAFLKDDVLTYALAMHLAELQVLLELGERMKLNILSLLAPQALGESRRSIYDRSISTLLALILMSPIFMQYAVEARSEVTVTPADIIVALLRIIKRRGEEGNLLVHMRDVVDEILKFWEGQDLTRRLKLYVRDEISPDALYSKRSLTVSLSLVINASAGQLHVFTTKKPELLLPPRMIGFDSLYVVSGRFSSILRRIFS